MAWIAAHQQLWVLFIWPVLSAVISGLLKLGTNSTSQSLSKLAAGMGTDMPKIMEAVGELLTPANTNGGGQ